MAGTMQNVTPMHRSPHNHARMTYISQRAAVTAPNFQTGLEAESLAKDPSEERHQVSACCMVSMLVHF